MKHGKCHKDEYRSDYFSKLICLYCEILISKFDLYQKHRSMISQGFSLNPYFSNRSKIEGSPLSIKVIRNLFNYWKQLIGIHQRITQSTYLRKIVSFIGISILEEEYPLICLITHLYQAFKVTAHINQVEYKVEKDMKHLDDKFIQNYASTYLFYHKVIRMPELEDVRPKLPYFPHSLLKHFKLNDFLNKIELKGEKSEITTFLNPANKICGVELPEGFSSHRLVALSEFNDFN